MPQTLRVLSFNTLFKGAVRSRLSALGPTLETECYDLVCLQELMYRSNLRLLASLTGGYPYQRASGALALKGGLALMSRFPIISCKFIRFPVTRPARPEWLMRKGLQVTLLDLGPGHGQRERQHLAVVNTHLSANLDDDWSVDNRYALAQRAELGQLERVLAELDPQLPVLVMGDLNLPPQAPGFARLLERAGLVDVPVGQTYRPTPSYPTPPVFDHLLVRAGGKVLVSEARTVFKDAVPVASGTAFLSDHYGLEARLVLES